MHPKTILAKKEWAKSADRLGFESDKQMLYFLYWEKRLRPKCIGSLIEKTPQMVSWHMKTLGIPRGQFREKTKEK